MVSDIVVLFSYIWLAITVFPVQQSCTWLAICPCLSCGDWSENNLIDYSRTVVLRMVGDHLCSVVMHMVSGMAISVLW